MKSGLMSEIDLRLYQALKARGQFHLLTGGVRAAPDPAGSINNPGPRPSPVSLFGSGSHNGSHKRYLDRARLNYYVMDVSHQFNFRHPITLSILPSSSSPLSLLNSPVLSNPLKYHIRTPTLPSLPPTSPPESISSSLPLSNLPHRIPHPPTVSLANLVNILLVEL